MYLEIAIVILLTLINGLLAMSELAIVSARPARLKLLADKGSKGAATAMRLAEDPGRFLSSVQIGITLVGIFAGAFSGATLGARLATALEAAGLPDGVSDTLGVGLVVVAITYLSLIFGELVPKQIALRDPEGVAARVAPAMKLVARATGPVVWLLDASGKAVLRLIGQGGGPEGRISDEEVRSVIAEAETAGVIKTGEREMIAGVMRLADRSARALMTPRRDVETLDAADPPETILRRLRETHRSRLPVRDGGPDEIVGVVVVRDLLAEADSGGRIDLRAAAQPAPVVRDGAGALQVIQRLRASTSQMALVFDEYGHFEGVVTPMDVLEAVTGDFREEEGEEPALVARADGSMLVAGWMPIDEFAERLRLELDPDRDYETVAGFALDRLGRLPELGESFVAQGWRYEVVDLDARRIDKLLVSRAPEEDGVPERDAS